MSRMSRVMAIANTPSLNASRRSVPRSVPPVSNWLMRCSLHRLVWSITGSKTDAEALHAHPKSQGTVANSDKHGQIAHADSFYRCHEGEKPVTPVAGRSLTPR